MLVVMTVSTVLKVLFEKAAPVCPSDVPAPQVLGLEHSCPWPREGLSSRSRSLALDFICVLGLGLEPCVLDSTSDFLFAFAPCRTG